MKYSFFLMFFLATINVAMAQIESGVIRYRETVKMDIEGIPEAFRDQIPTQMSSEALLSFSPIASYYEEQPRESQSHTTGSEEEGIMIKVEMGDPGSTYKRYNDLQTKSYIEQNSFMGRDFLINEKVENSFEWTETGEEQQFNGITLRKAMGTYNEMEVEAWYAPSIPVDIGPRHYSGLPGAILLMTRENLTIEFTSLEVLNDAPDMTPPTEGKKMSREKFEQMQDKKLKEMEGANGGRGERIIMRH